MSYKTSSKQSFSAFLLFLFVRHSFETCSMNHWCRPPTNLWASEYKFVVLTSAERMNWFEALQLCRNEGNRAELLYIESTFEREWLLTQMGSFESANGGMLNDNGDGALLWHVNAHKYLYNSDYVAWANGHQLEMFTSSTEQLKTCNAWGLIPYAVEDECLGLYAKENDDPILVYVNCTSAYTSKAICKKQKSSKEGITNSSALFNFTLADWVQSPRNKRLVYRILNDERESHGKVNWYSARLLCMKYGAELSDIEDDSDYKWLMALVEASHRSENLTGGTAYFVNFHRYLFNTREWTWGGPPNAERTFYMNFTVDIDHCEPQLCVRLRYAADPKDTMPKGLMPMYCGGKMWRARAICKKRLPLSETATSLSHTHKILINVMVVILVIVSILMFILFSFCGIQCFFARKIVSYSRRCAVHSETDKPGLGQRKETSTSYGPSLHQGPFSEYSVGGFDKTILPIQNQTNGLNSQQTENENLIENTVHPVFESQNSNQTCGVNSQQSLNVYAIDI